MDDEADGIRRQGQETAALDAVSEAQVRVEGALQLQRDYYSSGSRGAAGQRTFERVWPQVRARAIRPISSYVD